MSTIQDVLALKSAEQMKDSLKVLKPAFKKSLTETEEEYDVYKHKVNNPLKRKKKKIKVDSGKIDENGRKIYKEKFVDVCRIAVPLQKLLVERSAGFLVGRPVKYNLDANLIKLHENEKKSMQNLFDKVMSVFKENKMKYFDKKLARMVFRCCEAAELWYFVPDEQGHPTKEMRVRMLSPRLGDTLLPHFNDWGKMDGFCRCYKTKDLQGKRKEHIDIYTNTLVYQWETEGDGGTLIQKPTMPHGFKRIPVVYYRQEQTEWHDVQSEIERVETLLSNWGDTNDYFGSPSYFFKGTLQGFAEKGEQGKVYQGEGDADMRVLSWDNSPTSVTGELSQLLNIIFSYTQSPDISFFSMKQIGSNTSGTTMKLMFIDPIMKAEDKQELFGECFERRFNIVKDGIGQATGAQDSIIEATMCEPVFEAYLPKNEEEEIKLINLSTGGTKTMSQKTAIEKNPLVGNADTELEQINKETEEAIKKQQQMIGVGETYQEE